MLIGYNQTIFADDKTGPHIGVLSRQLLAKEVTEEVVMSSPPPLKHLGHGDTDYGRARPLHRVCNSVLSAPGEGFDQQPALILIQLTGCILLPDHLFNQGSREVGQGARRIRDLPRLTAPGETAAGGQQDQQNRAPDFAMEVPSRLQAFSVV